MGIEQMVEDSEKYAEADKDRKAAIEAANRADSVLNDTERALNEYADKLDKAEADEIKEKTTELQMASLNLFDKMHKARNEAGEQQQEQPKEGEKKDDTKP